MDGGMKTLGGRETYAGSPKLTPSNLLELSKLKTGVATGKDAEDKPGCFSKHPAGR